MTNKKIISLLLAASLGTSTLPAVAATNNYKEENSNSIYYDINTKDIKINHLNGFYTTLILNDEVQRPAYVYLNNIYTNKYLPKQQALDLMYNRNNETYLMAKKVKNINYVEGISNPNEKYRYVYALSYNKSVNGWARISKTSISDDTPVATTIELGEFLASDIDLTTYRTNLNGYTFLDINKDGMNDELVYIGNNKENMMLTKNDAIKYANDKKLYFYVIYLPTYFNVSTPIYALSEKTNEPMWTRIDSSKIPNNALIATNMELASANYLTDLYHKSLEEETIEINVPNQKPEYTYNFMKKDEALAFAYANYKEFCILQKVVYKENTNEAIVIYAFSTTPYVDGWTIIGNDFISDNSNIFLTMEDAYNYEAELNYNFGLKLK